MPQLDYRALVAYHDLAVSSRAAIGLSLQLGEERNSTENLQRHNYNAQRYYESGQYNYRGTMLRNGWRRRTKQY
jgi:hypothetical protein